MNSKRAGETTIKTSIRIRPCSQQEKETFPGPTPVQAAPGEVRLFQKAYLPSSGRNSPSNLNRSSRPATPTSPHVTPRAASSPSLAWRQQAAAQLSNDYQSYPFANVFGPEEGSEDVYNGSGCRDVVGAVLGGCNGTIFVYGQTGAGKTHTMDAVTDLVLQQLYAATDDNSSEVAITVSAVELYNEVLRCLLSSRENLQLRWASGAGSVNGVVLEGAEERPCGSIEEAAALVTMAKAARAVGETRANARSSRSHLIVRVKVEVLQLSSLAGVSPPSPTSSSSKRTLAASKLQKAAAPASVTFSMLNLVDLAGSERIDKSGSADTPLRLREALNINKSLLCLGNVVTALADRSEGKRPNHIPYRDSKLTRLLEDSLGGNATTALIACITPLPEWHLEQSRSTLEFAARAARIVCKPQRNVLNLAPAGGPSGDTANVIASLQAEIAALKKQLADQQQQQQPQLHALSVQPVSSSHTLWDNFGVFSSRKNSGALAGVAENAAEAGDQDDDSSCGSPTTASCPASPSGKSSPIGCGRSGGWTHRLRMSLGGSSGLNPSDAALGSSLDARLSGIRSPHPSRIPSPKHSLFSALASPRHSCKVLPLPAVVVDQPVGAPLSAVSAIQTDPAQQRPSGVTASDAGAGSSSGSAVPASAHTTSIISRASGTQRSLLWKLLQQPHPHGDRHSSGQPLGALNRISSSSSGTTHSGGPYSTQSLRSTGLLITSSGTAAAAAAAISVANSSSGGGSGGGTIARWSTFAGSHAGHGADAMATHDDSALPSHPVQLSPQGSLVHTGRSSIASRRLTTDGVTCTGHSIRSSNNGGLASGRNGNALLESGCTQSGVESRVLAAEAAMALRDHIIKQLVLALQQKKAEIRSLKEQLAAVLKQLESSEGQEEANKAKLRELAEGIQMLAAARQAEFEKWKGHLVGLEAALQAAQSEATNYRDDSQSLVQQLADLQARYQTLQTAQRNSLANVPVQQQQQQHAQGQSGTAQQQHAHEQQQQQQRQHQELHQQLDSCLKQLQAIASALQDMLRMPCAEAAATAAPGSRGVTPRHLSLSRSPSPGFGRQQQPVLQLCQLPEYPIAEESSASPSPEAADAGGEDYAQKKSSPHVKGEVESHRIQTISTRVYDGTGSRLVTAATPLPDLAGSLAAAAGEAAAAARLSHVEFVLAELQELMPLVKSATSAALKACQGSDHACGTPSAGQAGQEGGQLRESVVLGSLGVLGALPRQSSVLQSGSTVDNVEGKQQDQAVQTKEAKASLAGAALITAHKCHKCDSLKPLLVIMQKLKDEVVLLKAALRTKEGKLAASDEVAAGLKADLLESKQQVGALRERIDELSEELELARSAAAAAAAAVAHGSSSPSPSTAVAAAAGAHGQEQPPSQQQQQQQQQQVQLSLSEQRSFGRELSHRELQLPHSVSCRQVPLMAEDTPLEDLHIQILQSWQALSMPFAYRCAFVLGPSSNPSINASMQEWGSISGSDSAAAARCNAGSDADTARSSDSRDSPGDAVSTPSAAAAAAGGVLLQVVRQAPWCDRAQCQAHIALLACLHQYHEDVPAAAEQQADVLADEARVLDAGLAALPSEQLTDMLKRWGITQPTAASGADADTADAAAATAAAAAAAAAGSSQQRAALLAKLWTPGGAATAEALAADSAATCQCALKAAPAAELAAVSLRCNASVIAAASNALADAAS